MLFLRENFWELSRDTPTSVTVAIEWIHSMPCFRESVLGHHEPA